MIPELGLILLAQTLHKLCNRCVHKLCTNKVCLLAPEQSLCKNKVGACISEAYAPNEVFVSKPLPKQSLGTEQSSGTGSKNEVFASKNEVCSNKFVLGSAGDHCPALLSPAQHAGATLGLKLCFATFALFLPLLAPSCPFLPLLAPSGHGTARQGKGVHKRSLCKPCPGASKLLIQAQQKLPGLFGFD